MRIIAGDAGGIPLLVPRSLTRPTTDRVREAVFSSLGDRVPDARVLDLYAGSGALGIEALSRGAAHATFIDHDREACDTIRANLEKTRIDAACATIHCRPVRRYLERLVEGGNEDGFDLVFADPPYARDDASAAEIEALFAGSGLAAAVATDGVLVFESLARAELPVAQAGDEVPWTVTKQKRYGDTLVSFLQGRGTS